MNGEEFEARLRRGEWFHRLTVPPGMWTVLRVDGRAFAVLTQEQFTKPYDERLRDMMVAAARVLLADLGGVYAYTQSDEVSVLVPPESEGYGRTVEKLVSLAASVASAEVTLAAGVAAQFDARVWVGAGLDDVVDYFTWRQADAARSALTTWCYWTLRGAGHDPHGAAAALDGLGAVEQSELLHRHGVRFDEVPSWQRRGVGIYYRSLVRAGGDLFGGDAAPGRRRLHEDLELTSRDEYRAFVRAVVTGQL